MQDRSDKGQDGHRVDAEQDGCSTVHGGQVRSETGWISYRTGLMQYSKDAGQVNAGQYRCRTYAGQEGCRTCHIKDRTDDFF